MSGLYNLQMNHNSKAVANKALELLNLSDKDICRFRDIELYPFINFTTSGLLNEDLVKKYKSNILILTRIGGNNREYHSDNWDFIRKLKNYKCDFDSTYDNTYAFIVLEVSNTTLAKIQTLRDLVFENEYFLCEKNIFHDSIITVKKDKMKFHGISLTGSKFINEYTGGAITRFSDSALEQINTYCKVHNLNVDDLCSELRNRSLNTLISMIS